MVGSQSKRAGSSVQSVLTSVLNTGTSTISKLCGQAQDHVGGYYQRVWTQECVKIGAMTAINLPVLF